MQPRQNEGEQKCRTNVNVTIDCAELESIKAATRIDMGASALLAAARIGRDFLLKSLEMGGIEAKPSNGDSAPCA